MNKFSSFLVVLLLALASFSAQSQEYQRGDVDQDGSVGISDVSALIDYLLNGTWPDEPVTPEEPQIEIFTVNGISFSMVTVEGGTFTMGATPEQGSDAMDNEYPTHNVTLSTYSICTTEVTVELWESLMGPLQIRSYDDPQRPMENASWDDYQLFIAKLNQLTGRTFRMPTEAEWEFAARGGLFSQGFKYAGSDNIYDVAWFVGSNGLGAPHSVGSLWPNELGIFDMSGGASEWCQDWYGSYSSEAQTNPTGPATGTYRVSRGGGSWSQEEKCRVSSREAIEPSYCGCGLRLAL